MKPKTKTPVLIVGQIDGNAFQAEVHPRHRVIICSSEPLGVLLPNADTEERARIIARRLFMRHAPLSLFFRFWLFVEVQTCFGDVRLTRITYQGRSNGADPVGYHDLTPQETNRIAPLIQSFQEQLGTNEAVSTPSPSASR